ncbi:MAG TPA: LLM class flavin-dependent oxidoreductase [Nitrososphaerales archaeon]|nr:LLM class flavin-dependent oxidoreductase [Nitrososphaerales archaeon]
MKGTIKGFDIAPFASAEETLRYALLAEKHGVSGFWLGEGLHGRSATALLSAVAVQTKKIQLGTAIIGVYNRHPAIIAMEAATIDELSGGRFNIGIGVNVSSLVKHGLVSDAKSATKQKPYEAMKDSVEIIRGLLSGKNTVYHGQVFSLPDPGSTLNFHGFRPLRPNQPLYLGSRSPKILELTGQKADGVILSRSLSASGSYVKDSLKHISDGARKAGRSLDDLVIASNLTFSVSKDSELAKNHVKEVVALYVADPTLTAENLMLQHSKVKPEDLERVKQGLRQGGMHRAAELVSPEMIEEFAIAGNVDECVGKLEELGELGVQVPIAFDLIGPRPEEAIELIAKEIMPRLLDS